MIAEVALEEHADSRIGALSGGQRKRAAWPSSCSRRPSLLFLDEPTTGLDPELETRLMRLLRELAGRRPGDRRGHPRDEEPGPSATGSS